MERGQASARAGLRARRGRRFSSQTERVLDIGCGAGAFAAYIPHAIYVGLDDNYPAAGARRSTSATRAWPRTAPIALRSL
jgi:SAM-dependent methyltransferase